jgi:hypothetical protein
MKRQTAVALAASALATASVVLVAPTANADLVTHCIGSGGAVTVPGDLLVPPGESCTLSGTTVTGNVRVAADSNLTVDGGTFQRDVQIDGNGYFDARNTTVTGQVTLAPGGFGIFLKDSQSGNITAQPKGTAEVEGFVFLEHSKVNGNLTASIGEVRVDTGSEVTGNISTNGTRYTDLHDSFVDGSLSVQNNGDGSVVCGNAVQGPATFAGNQRGVQLGPNGGLDSCATGGYFNGDVSINNTTGAVRVDDNIINGRLQFSANDPVAIVAPTNRIRGGITGEHEAPADAAARSAAASRAGELQQRVQDRRATATKTAVVEGAADI